MPSRSSCRFDQAYGESDAISCSLKYHPLRQLSNFWRRWICIGKGVGFRPGQSTKSARERRLFSAPVPHFSFFFSFLLRDVDERQGERDMGGSVLCFLKRGKRGGATLFPPSLSLNYWKRPTPALGASGCRWGWRISSPVPLFERICLQERGGTEGALQAHFLQSTHSIFNKKILPFSLALPLSLFRS